MLDKVWFNVLIPALGELDVEIRSVVLNVRLLHTLKDLF